MWLRRVEHLEAVSEFGVFKWITLERFVALYQHLFQCYHDRKSVATELYCLIVYRI